MSSINQKEYLKKYLGIGKAPGEKKKKKRKEKTIGSRLKIVDDDIEASISQEIQDDLSATNEDAPLVVAVIDERPPSLRIDDVTKNNLWKPIGEPANDGYNFKLGGNFQLIKSKKDILIAQTKFRKPGNNQSLHSSQLKEKVKNDKYNYDMSSSQERELMQNERHNDDSSPPRKRRFEGDSFEKHKDDSSPKKKRFEGDSFKKHKDADFSPPRKNRDPENSKRYEDDTANQIDENIDVYSRRNNNGKKTENKDVDSYPQKNYYSTKPNNRKEDNYPGQHNRDDDISPPRKKNNSTEPNNRSDDNYSRQKTRNDYISPPRKRNNYTTESSNHSKDNYPRQKIRDDDISPPRKQKYINPKNIDHSPTRKNIREKDLPPIRQNKSHRNQNNSPPGYRNNYQDSSPKRNENEFSSPRPIIKSKSSSSPYKGSTSEHGQKKSRWGSPERSHDTSDKVKVTLSGKRAGLQNAKEITKEIISLREKEDNMFSNMSEEISGINAATVVRDRVPRDLEEEALKLRKQKETKEKYDKWGKGLKQVQDHNEKMAEQLYEMSKPLARYADDEDLDKYLKEQEREGDPMLAYIRKKKRKKTIEAGVPEKPTYMGEFMPNRFGIKPGYRWDGVDRSNGYEKKWFEVQNKKKANLEEAHKWSTEDM